MMGSPGVAGTTLILCWQCECGCVYSHLRQPLSLCHFNSSVDNVVDIESILFIIIIKQIMFSTFSATATPSIGI